jgi:formate hydrogenlyase transcriptional activator
LLLDVTNQVVSNLQLRDLLRAIWGNIRRVMQCDFASLALPHAENKQLQLYVLDFSEGKGFLHEEGRYSIEGSPYGTAFRTMKPVALDSPFTAWPDNPVVQSRICGGFKSLCFLPLIRRNRAIGTLNLGRLRDDAFTEEDLYFLSQVANQIAIAVENALAYRAMATLEEQRASERVYLEEEILSGAMFEEIVGSSKALVRTLGYVARVAPTDSTVLITGESGTGKELVARALHKRSRRASRPFVRVNCAAIPPSLIASELFGHEKGAFTGATEQRLGRFELANGGTIFLDEIGDVPADTQIALLRVLQERELDRVGGSHPVSVDVRVVAATNRDLKAAVDAGTFRLDLFYRLNVFPVRVPSLRERADDIPLLTKYFIERYATTAGKRIRNIDKKTLELFQAYHWPGNIREMQNVIERAVILCDRETFSVDESWMQREAPPSVCETPVALTEALVSREKQMIQAALEESRGRIFGPSGAAVKLGIPRSTLESRIRTLRIDKYRFRAEERTSTTSILANSRQLAKSHHG